MRTYTLLCLALLFTFMTAAGCAKNQNEKKIVIPKNAAKLKVDFSWDGIAACGHRSPEIKVSGVPAAAKRLNVQLINVSDPTWNQGGGEVVYDGSGVIPADALNLGYNGPCPPPEKRQKYEFQVMAVDADGTIIGFGKARESFPPKH